jgi:PAS domain S-box-containing protein
MAENAKMIRELLDESPIGVAVVDTATRKRVYVNRAFVEMFGASSGDQLVQASVLSSWVNPDDLAKLQQSLDIGEPVENFEAERRRIDGSSWWALMNTRPIVFEGQPARVVWHTDITERKHAEAVSRQNEEKAREAQDRLMSAIEALEDGFVLYDKDDRFVLANQKYRMIYPKSAEAMVSGTPFETILRHGLAQGEYDTQGKSVEQWMEQRLREHNSGERNVEQKLANGTWLKIAERKTERGELVGFRVDVTDLKEIQEQLSAAKEVAEIAVEVKSAFLASMSHEVRTPLGGILGLSDILMSTTLTAEQRELVEKLKAAGSGLLVILNDILDLSKLEAGKLAIESINYDLSALIEESMDLFAPKAQASGIDLRVDISDDVPGTIYGDPTRIRQILINLIGNAVKFTHHGGVSVEARTASMGTAEQVLQFGVRDTGIGIAADAIGGLFEDFVQADASTSRRYAGTGLGLAISRRLVELMDGKIDVNSVEGEGSVFSFQIPLVPATSTSGLVAPSKSDGDWQASEQLDLLIAEDNELNQLIINALLAPLGHTITFADNGLDAVESLKGGTHDLVLMDIRMPGMSGIEATRLIRKLDGDIAQTPIIALTADAMADNRREYLEAGMNACVTKPINRNELLESVNDVLGRPIHLAGSAVQPSHADHNTTDEPISDDVLVFLSDIDELTKSASN